MTTLKYKHDDLLEGYCTAKQYYDQFDTARDLNVGMRYHNNLNSFMCTTYEITYIDDKVALAIEVGGSSVGSYCLFYSTGNMAGWKYQDSRSSYRLRPLK